MKHEKLHLPAKLVDCCSPKRTACQPRQVESVGRQICWNGFTADQSLIIFKTGLLYSYLYTLVTYSCVIILSKTLSHGLRFSGTWTQTTYYCTTFLFNTAFSSCFCTLAFSTNRLWAVTDIVPYYIFWVCSWVELLCRNFPLTVEQKGIKKEKRREKKLIF